MEPVLSPVPQCKGSRIAQSVETSNAESPTQNEYSINLSAAWMAEFAIHLHYGLSINIPRGRPCCLVFDWLFELARFLHCQNQGVRKRLCPWCHPALYKRNSCKDTQISLKCKIRERVFLNFAKYDLRRRSFWFEIYTCIRKKTYEEIVYQNHLEQQKGFTGLTFRWLFIP